VQETNQDQYNFGNANEVTTGSLDRLERITLTQREEARPPVRLRLKNGSGLRPALSKHVWSFDVAGTAAASGTSTMWTSACEALALRRGAVQLGCKSNGERHERKAGRQHQGLQTGNCLAPGAEATAHDEAGYR
jgi:hypothetical protein